MRLIDFYSKLTEEDLKILIKSKKRTDILKMRQNDEFRPILASK
jgi:hypothetical protein